jgi:hypothetical protein
MQRDGFFMVAANVLAFGELRFRGSDNIARRSQSRVERLLAFRRFTEATLRVLRGGVEALEDDQFFEISIHK